MSLYQFKHLIEVSLTRPLLLPIYLLLCLFLAMPYTNAWAGQWQLEMLKERYRISIKSDQGDRLMLSHKGEDTQFIIQTAQSQTQPNDRYILQIWFDTDNSIIETGLVRLDRNTYQIQLTGEQKDTFIKQMINHVELHVRYPFQEQNFRQISFSLLGFTAVLNDLLIAHEIGHLDPEWLNENHKNQELMCYYAANFSVQAMLYRKQGLTLGQTLQKLKSKNSEALDDVINDIVTQIYHMDRGRLPLDPRGDKFGIFQRCMEHYKH